MKEFNAGAGRFNQFIANEDVSHDWKTNDPPRVEFQPISRTENARAKVCDGRLPVAFDDISCYTVKVPEKYGEPLTDQTRLLKLDIWIYHGGSRGRLPIVSPMGGPAKVGVTWLRALGRRTGRRVLSWDYRGLGASRPRVECFSRRFGRMSRVWEWCKDFDAPREFRFNYYGAVDHAMDLEAIRQANPGGFFPRGFYIYGHSYGSTVSMVYTEWFGRHVHKVILSGVWWPGYCGQYCHSRDQVIQLARRVHADFANDNRNQLPANHGRVLDDFINAMRGNDLNSEKLQHLFTTEARSSPESHGGNRVTRSFHAMNIEMPATPGPPSIVDYDNYFWMPDLYFTLNECLDGGPAMGQRQARTFNHFPDAGSMLCREGGFEDLSYSRSWLLRPPTFNKPTLIISGTYDPTTPSAMSKFIYDNLRRNNRDHRVYLRFVPRFGHQHHIVSASALTNLANEFWSTGSNVPESEQFKARLNNLQIPVGFSPRTDNDDSFNETIRKYDLDIQEWTTRHNQGQGPTREMHKKHEKRRQLYRCILGLGDPDRRHCDTLVGDLEYVEEDPTPTSFETRH